MRLLLVTQDFPPAVGGIQTYSKALADRFAESTEHFGVVAPHQPGCRDVDRGLAYPVFRIPVPSDGMRYALLPYLSYVCWKGGFRVAFLAQWYSGAAANMAKRTKQLDRVYTAAHGQELLRVPSEGKWLGRAYVKHRQRVLPQIDGFFPVSRYTASLLEDLAVPASKIHVVYNGTDIERFAISADERARLPAWRHEHGLGAGPLLLTAARLVRRKGVDAVLEALPAIARRVPAVHYAVVGSGPERDNLERRAGELGVRERVTFLGKLPDRDVVMAYNACDAFVMPARFEHPSVEGFGLVFREANACGKPVVGSRTGGIADAIEDGRTGLLIEPDDIEALTGAVLRLLEDPSYAALLGRQGRELVTASGTWQHAADRMLEVMRAAAS